MPAISNARRWAIVALLFAAGFVNYLDRAILSIALPVIAADLRLGPEAKGMLLSAFFWSYALMQVPVGWVADRGRLRVLYAGAFVVWSVASGLTGLAQSLAVLLGLRVLLGIGESLYLPGAIRIVSRLFEPAKRGLASGIVNSGTRAGLAVGAPLIAWMVVRFAWRNTFFLVGFVSLLWVIPWLLVFPADESRSASQKRRPMPWRNRNLIALCIGQIGYNYFWYLLVTWLPDYLVESRHVPLARAGTYAMIPYLVFALSEPLGGWAGDRLIRMGWRELPVRKGIISAAFAASLALLPVGWVHEDWIAVGLIAVSALVGLATGNLLALLQKAAPAEEVGLWTGTLNFAGNFAGILAPLVTGVLIGRTGSYLPGFAIGVGMLFVVLPAYWCVKEE